MGEPIEINPFAGVEPEDQDLRITATARCGLVNIFFVKAPHIILNSWTLSAWDDDARNKTLGMLIRGDGKPPVFAKSGWGTSLDQYEHKDPHSPIKGSLYTQKAWQLCERLGSKLHTSAYDGDTPGYFEASHVGMHLMAWLVEEHFPHLYQNGVTKAETPPPFMDVLIISNREPYTSAYQLAECIRRETGVKIHLESRRV